MQPVPQALLIVSVLTVVCELPAGHASAAGGSEAPVVFEIDPSSVLGNREEELPLEIHRLSVGLALSVVAMPVGLGVFVGGVHFGFRSASVVWPMTVIVTSFVLMVGGAVGTSVTAALLRQRKKEQRELRRRRRVQWSYERGAFVF